MEATGTSLLSPAPRPGALPPGIPADRVLGIDVGGGSARALLADERRAVAAWRLPGGNLTLAPEPLLEALRALCDVARPQRIAIGLAGLRTAREHDRAALRVLLDDAAPDGVVLLSDATAALLGAFAGAPGAVVCAGTGTVAVAGEPDDAAIVGGHGFLVDDLGGAYDIGRRGLRAALRRRDRGERSLLGDAIERAAGVELRTLVGELHAAPGERARLAALAPLVTASRDPDAAAVVAAAADALVELAETVRVRWPRLPLAWSGGVFASDAIRASFVARTGARAPVAPPQVGALLALARR